MYNKVVFNNKKLGKIVLNDVSSIKMDYEYYVSVVNNENDKPTVTNVFKSDIYSVSVLGKSYSLTDKEELRMYKAVIIMDGKTLGIEKVFSERIEGDYLVLSEISGFSKDQKTMFYTDHYLELNKVLKVSKTDIESCTVELPKEESDNTATRE